MANQNIFIVKGAVERVYPEQSGVSNNGSWTKQEFVLKNEERNYIYRYCFVLFGKKVDAYRGWIQIGKELTVTFGIDTFVHDERAYTSLRVIEIVETDHQLDALQQQLQEQQESESPF